ncbi:uncharacterized protein LY89DRAFT_666787 [Mollisia scopiformis]|uniref:Uncharacterized protein n=1 Tax=Mollisia scopiformis TaxID=149040 RepID=A0A194XII9_MOLSC|nr:uncharacterized protein LY89DRAFT_666787 [Mollisia scopiformis]KUJ19946.1 hypothetical protein LY89DRAFT_666787 [Mollisia scopiformis]
MAYQSGFPASFLAKRVPDNNSFDLPPISKERLAQLKLPGSSLSNYSIASEDSHKQGLLASHRRKQEEMEKQTKRVSWAKRLEGSARSIVPQDQDGDLDVVQEAGSDVDSITPIERAFESNIQRPSLRLAPPPPPQQVPGADEASFARCKSALGWAFHHKLRVFWLSVLLLVVVGSIVVPFVGGKK